MIDTNVLAANTLQLLQADPSRYRNFGVYWYLIKAVLKKYYTQDNLFLLGDYVDKTVTDRLPAGQSLEEALNAAVVEYQHNATYNLGRATVTDPDGEEFIIMDQDAGGL
jgi:hypothetical protein